MKATISVKCYGPLCTVYVIDDKTIEAQENNVADEFGNSSLEIIEENRVREDLICWGAELDENLEIQISIGDSAIPVSHLGFYVNAEDFEDQSDEDTDPNSALVGFSDNFPAIGDGVVVGGDQKLVVEVVEIYNMTLSTTLDVESENLSASDFTLYGFDIDGLTDYSAVTYGSGIIEVDKDVRGVIYQGKQYPLGVEYEGGSSELSYFSQFVEGVWTTDWTLQGLFSGS